MSDEPAPLPPLNNLPCGGKDNEQDSCQHIFIYTDSSRILCFKCVSEKGAEAITNYKFRSKCGLTGSKVTDPCGICEHRETEAKGLANEAKEAARRARAAQAQLSFKTGSKPMVDVTNHVVGPSTSMAELQDIWTSNKSACWTLTYKVCLDTKINGCFGTQTYAAYSDELIPAALDGMVKQINLHWTEYNGHELALLVKRHPHEEEDKEPAQGKRKAGSNSYGNSAGTRGFTGWGCDGVLAKEARTCKHQHGK
ncbi:hypothetical protein B0H17DRAFT_1145548 [Mycena rosella]|uniref:Uncharacterized protein n=1 Tax=Mycena rosella TaxID=1033263 RepID=A0AAD7CQR4_MYCRO|nr:hypothetical protein B0H17DRAFT_1145548 [Mycena rosella]